MKHNVHKEPEHLESIEYCTKKPWKMQIGSIAAGTSVQPFAFVGSSSHLKFLNMVASQMFGGSPGCTFSDSYSAFGKEIFPLAI